MENKKYIAVIDSGFGGLSVLRRLLEIMPEENFIFYGDSKNAPYGVKTKEEIIELTENIVETLIPYDIKQLIIACNTISVTATEILRKKYPNLSIIPTTPNVNSIISKEGLKDLVEIKGEHIQKTETETLKRNKPKVLIIATPSTCKSEFVKEEVEKHQHLLDIYIEPANPLVHFVESLKAESKECEDYLRNELLSQYKDINYLVLGCTHFPFVSNNISKVYKDSDVQLIDNAVFVAQKAKDYLEKFGLLETKIDEQTQKTLKIIDTKGGTDRQIMFSKLLGINLERLEFI